MNKQLLVTLPQVRVGAAAWSTLARLDGKGAWKFLVQPTEISYDRAVSYSPSNTVGTLPNLQFGLTEAWQVAINGLPLSTRHDGRSLLTYVQSLSELQEPDATAKSPPVLALVWGQRRFSPVVLTRFSKRETFWTPSGDLLECTVSFSLTEVPENQIINI